MKRENTEAHVSEKKKQVVKKIAELFNQYPIVAVVNMENLPAKQLQKMRAQLRKDVVMVMTKRTLIENAIKKCEKKNLSELSKYLGGMPALIFTKENPFKLYRIIKKNKSPAAIKAGQTAPKEIIVPKGPTGFAPGPIIGELGALRIKTAIENGKIAVKEDAVVAKKGDVIKPVLASVLMRLGIEPMEIGLDLVVAYENGDMLTKDVLNIDEDAFMNKLKTAINEAFNLAVDVAYPSKETIELLIQKSFRDSKNIALERNILADLIIADILAKTERGAMAVNSLIK